MGAVEGVSVGHVGVSGKSGERDRKSVEGEELWRGVRAYRWLLSTLQRLLDWQTIIGSSWQSEGSPSSRL